MSEPDIFRDKEIDDILMYFFNDDIQNYPLFKMKLLVENLRHCYKFGKY